MTDLATVKSNFKEFAAKTWPDNQRFKRKKTTNKPPIKRPVKRSRVPEQTQIKRLKEEIKALRKELKSARKQLEFFVECEQGVINSFNEFYERSKTQ